MDQNHTPHSDDELLAHAIERYRAGELEAALRAFDELHARGALSADLAELREDIQLKLVFDDRLGAVAAPAAPRRPRLRSAPIWAGGLALLLALAGGVAALSTLTTTSAPVAAQPAAVIGALPTAAPTATPQPTPPPTEGELLVEPAAGGALTRPADNIYLIFDASGSMLADLGDRPKIDIAQEAFGQLVDVLPEGAQVALRTYGRNRPDDCSDSELVSPLAPLDRAGLAAQVSGIRPVNLGRTPLATSLGQVPADLATTQGDTLVLLLSDGDETCNGDPVAVAAELHAANPRLRVSVVGFAVNEQQQALLAGIARAGGGSFFAANDVAQLSGALRQAVVPVFRVLDEGGQELARGDLGTTMTLKPGRYDIMIGEVAPLTLDGVAVRPGALTLVEVREEAGALFAEVRDE